MKAKLTQCNIDLGDGLSVLRAIIIGVSDYVAMNENDLPFCKNDISAVCDALVCGL